MFYKLLFLLTLTTSSHAFTGVANWTKRGPACGGVSHGGYCWYLGAVSASCDTACTGRGGCNSAGVVAYGSGGTDPACEALILAITGGPIVAGFAPISAAGCLTAFSSPNQNPARATNATTCAATAATKQRACSCNN